MVKQIKDIGGDAVAPATVRTATLRAEVARHAAYTDPGTDFPLEVFLSGPDAPTELDVTVAWRATGTLDLVSRDVPVLDGETVSIPLRTLRAILQRASGARVQKLSVSDLDTGTADKVGKSEKKVSKAVLAKVRVRGPRNQWSVLDSVWGIRPGAQLVLDCSLGGYSSSGLEETFDGAVTDISETVALAGRFGRFLLTDADLIEKLAALFDMDASKTETSALAEAFYRDRGLPENVPVTVLTINSVDTDTAQFVISFGDAQDVSFDGARRCPITLGEHGNQVGRWTREAASVLPLSDDLVATLAEAGHRHDDGKADPRFQRYLCGKGAAGDPALAKARPRSYAADIRVRERSGLPSGWRHEVASANIVDDLTRHLVVSHHRWGRPLIVHPDNAAQRSGDDRITAHTEVFDALTGTYGPWGLALIETVLRWADHRASAHPDSPTVSVAHDAPVKTVVDGPVATPPRLDDSQPRHVLALPGLVSSPLAGTLAAVGLLAAVRRQLDSGAVLRWNPDTGIAEIGTEADVSLSVQSLKRDLSEWSFIDAEMKEQLKVTSGSAVDYAKVPLPDVRALTDLPDGHLLHRLLPDTLPRSDEKDVWRLNALLMFPNNGGAYTPSMREAGTGDFFDPARGFVSTIESGVKTGGVDVERYAYPGTRSRPAVLAWALDGHLALGWSHHMSATTESGRRLVLPKPARWTTLSGYAALATSPSLTRKGAHAAWKRRDVYKGQYVWEEVVEVRSDESAA